MDVISLISKRNSFSDVPEKMSFAQVMEKVYANGPKIHKYLKEMNSKILKKYDIVTVGEGPGINLACGPKYVSEKEKELNSAQGSQGYLPNSGFLFSRKAFLPSEPSSDK